ASVDPASWTEWTQATGFKARLGVPLYSGGRIVGAFFMASRTAGRFTDEHVGAARQIADLIGPFVENVVLLQMERRRRERLPTISPLPPTLGPSRRLRDVHARLGAAVKPALDFDLLGVSRLRASGTEFERIAMLTGARPAAPRTISVDESSLLPRLRQGKVVLIRDVQSELDVKGALDREIIESGIRSLLLAPLVFGEKVVGGMFFAKRRPSGYDESAVEVVRGIADGLVLGLQHQRLAEEQQRAAVAEAATQQLEKRVQSLRGALEERYGFETIQGRSPLFAAALNQAKKV